MRKRVLILAMASVLLLSVVFTACNNDEYVNPVSGEEYILVTDENGKKVLSEDGELLVYVTNENGSKVKDDDGNFVTEVQGFIGQIENDGVVEDYAYYFTLPEGYKAVNDRGEFQNKKKNIDLEIRIKEDTFNDYYNISRHVYETLIEHKDGEAAGIETDWAEFNYSELSSKAYIFSAKTEQSLNQSMFFLQNDNLYVISLANESDMLIEDGKKELLTIYDAIEFKPYTYYEDLSDSVTLKDESTTVALTEVE